MAMAAQLGTHTKRFKWGIYRQSPEDGWYYFKIKSYDSKLYFWLFNIRCSIYISNVYTTLNRLDGVVDVKKVQFDVKTGSSYSSMDISIDEIYSSDGTFLKTPKNAVLEIKFPEDDIKGIIV